ncbi:MAG: hypothetical protein ACXU8N_18395 [Telluria sp.]
MPSEVDICNLALASLGDDATVASLDPPEGSAQADHCARFYPMARDLVLDSHRWGFATRRVALALLSAAPPSAWRYAYALPGDMLNAISVLAPDALDDNGVGTPVFGSCAPVDQPGNYTPQPFVTEIAADGTPVLYTNQVNAVLRYAAQVTDPTVFPPTVVQGIAMRLASMLAGPVLKGETGIKAASLWGDRAEKWLAQAKESDANQQHQQVAQTTSWIGNR